MALSLAKLSEELSAALSSSSPSTGSGGDVVVSAEVPVDHVALNLTTRSRSSELVKATGIQTRKITTMSMLKLRMAMSLLLLGQERRTLSQ